MTIVALATPGSWRGIVVYSAVVLAGATAVSLVLRTRHLSVVDPPAGLLVFAAMWMPALARFIATRTVDRGWRPPFPLKRWGHPRAAVMLVPLAIVCAIYSGAYAIVWMAGGAIAAPVWPRDRVLLNVVVNLPLLASIGLVASLGEELGWRGYLQPRLDQLGVRGSLFWVIALETAFHTPLILCAGYLGGETSATSIALFFGLSLGLTPVWTWATYHWRTIWIAVWFHTFHNAVSQVLAPKALGAGDPRILGESGVLPVALYLVAAAAIFGIARSRGIIWREFARAALSATSM